MSSVPLSDGCKSPMKMHRTSSCGCASSVITSIGSKRRLQREAVACRGSRYNMWQLLSQFTSVSACDHCFTDGQGTAGGLSKSCAVDASSRPSFLMFFDRWALCVMSHDRFVVVVAWAVLALEATQTGSDDLKEIFESHLVEAGHMLVLLDTIVSGAYLLIYLIWWKCVSTCEYVTERLWNTYLGGSIMWW